MRIFSINPDGSFAEFARSQFQADFEESVLETWLENNANDILEDGKLLVIGRQVTTNLGSIIDLLGLDREGNAVVIELKRDRTPRETLAQALEYASFIEELDSDRLEEIFQRYMSDSALSMAEYHRAYFDLAADEAVSFNKDQRVVLVGQRITGEIRQTAAFLRKKGLRVTCLEFSYFKAEHGAHLLSSDIVVGREASPAKRISSGTLPSVTEHTFLESLDENGKRVFTELLRFASANSLPLHWGTRGFSMNADKDGVHVVICFGYPPACFKQSIYTAMLGRGGLLSKLAIAEADVEPLWNAALATGLFQPAGRELKAMINRPLTTTEIKALLGWIEQVVAFIHAAELK